MEILLVVVTRAVVIALGVALAQVILQKRSSLQIFRASLVCLFAIAASALPAQQPIAPEFRLGQLGFGFQLTPDGSCRIDRRVPTSFTCIALAHGQTQLAGIPVDVLVGTYLDGKLYRLRLEFLEKDYGELLEVLTASYGKPITSVSEPVQNRAGAQFANEGWSWKILDGDLVLWKYSSTLDKAVLIATHKNMSAEYEKRRKAAVAEAARQLKAPERASASSSADGPDTSKAREEPRTYLEFQVEKPVIQIPGTGSPAYPKALRSSGVEGEVQAQFVVNEEGVVDIGTFKILKATNELFSAAVRFALPNMHFYPAEVGGKKVRQLVQQTVDFKLDR